MNIDLPINNLKETLDSLEPENRVEIVFEEATYFSGKVKKAKKIINAQDKYTVTEVKTKFQPFHFKKDLVPVQIISIQRGDQY